MAALALLNTVTASAAGVLSWLIAERLHVGKCTLVGAATGLVAGLGGLTPHEHHRHHDAEHLSAQQRPISRVQKTRTRCSRQT